MLANDTVMAGNIDDVTGKPSYGWIFSLVTAFGLLLFLAMSFTFYHRRLMVRRKKEEEYNRFFRFLRPDLDEFEKKITRARSILTNTHNVDSFSINNEVEYYNEAFEDGRDSVADSEDSEGGTNLPYAKLAELQSEEAIKNEMEDHDVYMRSVKARKQVLFADVHSETTFGDSDHDVRNVVDNENATEGIRNDECDEQLEGEVDNNERDGYKDTNTTSREIRKNNSSQMQDRDYETVRQSNYKIVAQKPPILKPVIEINTTDELLKKNTILKPIKPKKKKRSLLSHAYKKSATSLDIGNRDISVFYSEPRRSSEPGLFLYNEEAADPQDAKLYDNQNKVLFNPYYTDIGMPMNKTQKRRSCTAEDENEIDVFKESHLKRERTLPVLDEIYDKHVPASTWM
ncbi:uncharacterized protein LOC123539189 isoform X2 [Mercenaria mercenaria]|uniref:uncharacterized protein LOC123539189 isoform X2 n=1 Tax=Mercenaria mercenaria TaxID=6596 RepID=UPI00234EADA2|nr:uncharacterized protein LOC123539189 isoform X2 [Mercenaria mercenaria]